MSGYAKLSLATALCVVLSAACASEGTARNDKPIGAIVLIAGIHSKHGVGEMRAISILSAKLLAELEAFFPRYKERPSSDIGVGTETKYQVYFSFKDGRAIWLDVGDDTLFWSVGRGSLETNGDFENFVKKLSVKETSNQADIRERASTVPAVVSQFPKPASSKMTPLQAFLVAKKAAESAGYDLQRFAYPKIRLDADRMVWSLFFQRKVDPAPGAHFWVIIQDQTRQARVRHGE